MPTIEPTLFQPHPAYSILEYTQIISCNGHEVGAPRGPTQETSNIIRSSRLTSRRACQSASSGPNRTAHVAVLLVAREADGNCRSRGVAYYVPVDATGDDRMT